MNRVQEWVLFFLIDRERNGLVTMGRNVLSDLDVEPLVESGFVTLEQTHAVSTLQKKHHGNNGHSSYGKRKTLF